MLTEKDYCDYDTCVALKELGYPLTSKEVRYEDKAVFVPSVLLYTAQKWLREEKGIDVMIIRDYWCTTRDNPYCRHYFPKLYRKCDRFEKAGEVGDKPTYDSYEEALLEGVRESVKLLKEERK